MNLFFLQYKPSVNALIYGLALTLCCFSSAFAESAGVAVAGNFRLTAQELIAEFKEVSGYSLSMSSASSGKLYAQVINGAPYDVFMSADADRPKRLEEADHAVAGSRFTYALGGLVLWSADERYKGENCLQVLQSLNFRRLAIANPNTAPYGLAARQTLLHLGLLRQMDGRLAVGENIAQVLQFVKSLNASIGFIARAQTYHPNIGIGGCRWEVPEEYHQPIQQQVVLLNRGADNIAAKEFMIFLKSTAAQNIIKRFGYKLPAVRLKSADK